MKYNYTLTLADYKAALKLHQRAKRSRRVVELFLYKCMPLLALLAISYELIEEISYDSFVWEHTLRLLIVPAFFLLLPVSRWDLVRKQFKQLFPAGSENLSIDIDDDRIICMNPGRSESKFTWNSIKSFAQDGKIAMLYISEDRFLFFPTSGFSPAERRELQSLVERNLAWR
jgi:hypothetical protein